MMFLVLLTKSGWPDSTRLWFGHIFLTFLFGGILLLLSVLVNGFARRQSTSVHIKQKGIEHRSWHRMQKIRYQNDTVFSFSILEVGELETEALVLIPEPNHAIILEMSSEVSQAQIRSILEQFITYEPICPLGSHLAFDQIEFE